MSVSKLLKALPLLVLIVTAACTPSDDDMPVVGILEWERLELVSETSEPITHIEVREGDVVGEGQLLLKQDDRRTRSDLDAAQASEQQAKARLQELIAGPRVEDIAEAKAALESARVAESLAKSEYKRINKLHDQKLASREQLDIAESQQRSARAALQLNQARLDRLLHGTREEQIAQARAEVASATARVRRLHINLQHLNIVAPRDGRVDSLPFIVGEQPPPGSVLAVLLVEDAPYARVYVPEQMRSGIRPGVKAQVWLDGVDEPFAGKVRMISHDPSFTPYYSLTRHDRSRLSYLAKVDLTGVDSTTLSAGTPLQVVFSPDRSGSADE